MLQGGPSDISACNTSIQCSSTRRYSAEEAHVILPGKFNTVKQWAVRTGEGRSLILKTSILKTKELSEKGLPNNQFG